MLSDYVSVVKGLGVANLKIIREAELVILVGIYGLERLRHELLNDLRVRARDLAIAAH